MSIIHGRNPEGESVTGTNPVLIGAKDINGKSILLTTDADGKLQVATDLQVTATDVTIHDSTTPENKLKINTDGSVNTQLSGSNVELKAKTTITWDGIDKINNVEIPVSSGDVLVHIDNKCDKDLTVTLEHEVEDSVWASYFMGDGTEISFTIPATVSGVFGVFQKFPKFLGGRIVFTAAEEPTADGTTVVQVQEV